MREAMIRLWVTSIVNQKKTLENVPKGLREGVREELILAGRQDLLEKERTVGV